MLPLHTKPPVIPMIKIYEMIEFCFTRVKTMAKAFYLHQGVYTDFAYHTFLRLISKSFIAIKDINIPLVLAKFQTDWCETVENKSDSKLISDSGVWCNER